MDRHLGAPLYGHRPLTYPTEHPGRGDILQVEERHFRKMIKKYFGKSEN